MFKFPQMTYVSSADISGSDMRSNGRRVCEYDCVHAEADADIWPLLYICVLSLSSCLSL